MNMTYHLPLSHRVEHLPEKRERPDGHLHPPLTSIHGIQRLAAGCARASGPATKVVHKHYSQSGSIPRESRDGFKAFLPRQTKRGDLAQAAPRRVVAVRPLPRRDSYRELGALRPQMEDIYVRTLAAAPCVGAGVGQLPLHRPQ